MSMVYQKSEHVAYAVRIFITQENGADVNDGHLIGI
jgi:hypothetical protein